MEKIIRKLNFGKADSEALLSKEWIVTNGLGGYATGTIGCIAIRRYHGYLVSALPAPLGRIMMLNNLTEQIQMISKTSKKSCVVLGGKQFEPAASEKKTSYLTEFILENGIPKWRYEIDNIVLEKRLIMTYMQNTTYISYHLISDQAVELFIRPSVEFRPHWQLLKDKKRTYTFSSMTNHFEIFLNAIYPKLKMTIEADKYSFILDNISYEFNYPFESQAGYDSLSTLWSPGYFCINLNPGSSVYLIASTEKWNLKGIDAFNSEDVRRTHLIENAKLKNKFDSELVLAADQFIIIPAGRTEEAVRANALGDEVRTVIAGYHWFTDWGRDTMISLEGLTQCTGRIFEAGWILRTFAHYIKNGLIPNMFPEQRKQGIYQTADATLWFFHALDRYIEATKDRFLLRQLLPKLIEIIDAHFNGTLFGIGLDTNDGLLKQGQQGVHLTWMDAKCGDWIVTPRRGKAVEINALWYNALSVFIRWLKEENLQPENFNKYCQYVEKARENFNKRFWYPNGGYLYDIVDGENGDDNAIRPNQIFAISLPNAVLDEKHWQPVIDVVQKELLTPYGLRSLAENHPDYKSKYFGDLRSRDAAYHQGTVWAWLIGPFIDAYMKKNPNAKDKAREFLKGFEEHLSQSCIGTISEIFDAEKPFTSRGCISQAWSVAEVLRCLYKTMR